MSAADEADGAHEADEVGEVGEVGEASGADDFGHALRELDDLACAELGHLVLRVLLDFIEGVVVEQERLGRDGLDRLRATLPATLDEVTTTLVRVDAEHLPASILRLGVADIEAVLAALERLQAIDPDVRPALDVLRWDNALNRASLERQERTGCAPPDDADDMVGRLHDLIGLVAREVWHPDVVVAHRDRLFDAELRLAAAIARARRTGDPGRGPAPLSVDQRRQLASVADSLDDVERDLAAAGRALQDHDADAARAAAAGRALSGADDDQPRAG